MTPERIQDFIIRTLLSIESSMYKKTAIAASKAFQLLLKCTHMNKLFVHIAIDYFNHAFRSVKHDKLKLKNDPNEDAQDIRLRNYFVNYFEYMHQTYPHSYSCLITSCFTLSIQIAKCFDRSKFDISSYESYMASVSQQLIRIIEDESFDEFTHDNRCADDEKCQQTKTQHKLVHLIHLNIPSHTSLLKQCGGKQMVLLKFTTLFLNVCNNLKLNSNSKRYMVALAQDDYTPTKKQ